MNNGPVLIIDDDEDVRNVMCFALDFEGIPTIDLKNAKKALEYLVSGNLEQYPSLIIVDFMMADMTGIQFINSLRKLDSQVLSRIPIVLSTARCSFELADEGLPERVRLLEKPLDLNQFVSLAKEYYSANPLVSSF